MREPLRCSEHLRQFRLAVLDANSYWTEQIFRACATDAEILLLKPRDFRSNYFHHNSFRGDSSPRAVSDHVWEQRMSLSPGWMFQFRKYSENRFRKAIGNFARNSPLIYVFNYPQYHSLLGKLSEKLSIYYNTDDYCNHWPRRSNQVAEWERSAIRGANITICIAAERCRQLKQRFPAEAERIFHIPIGCTPSFMASEVILEPITFPERLAHLERPVVGYIGALNGRFDYEFLHTVASLLPDVSFALGGRKPRKGEGGEAWWRFARACLDAKNIDFFGQVPHAEIGRYLQSFDALAMVYADTPSNVAACPAKLWDYLGTSLPIVANEVVPELRAWSDALYLCDTPEEFARCVASAFNEDRRILGEHRLTIAREHVWSRLAERMLRLIRSHF